MFSKQIKSNDYDDAYDLNGDRAEHKFTFRGVSCRNWLRPSRLRPVRCSPLIGITLLRMLIQGVGLVKSFLCRPMTSWCRPST